MVNRWEIKWKIDYEVFVSTRGKRLTFYLELIPFVIIIVIIIFIFVIYSPETPESRAEQSN